MTLNRNSSGKNKNGSRSISLKIGLIVASQFFMQLAQAVPISIYVTDGHNQALSHAVVEVIKQKSPLNVASSQLQPAVMDQVNKQFLPDLLLIQRGQSVLFPNSDNIRHHVYSFSKTKPFELKLYAGKPKNPIKFETSGVVIVGCNIHDSMVGSIYVAQNSAMMSDETGKVIVDFDPINDQISLWHPHQKDSPEVRKIIDINHYQSSDGSYHVSIDIIKPVPRDTFRDTFQ